MVYIVSQQGLPPSDEEPSYCSEEMLQRKYPQLKVFHERRSAIHTGILCTVCSVAHRAFAKHLISDTVRRDVTGTLSPLTPDQKTNRFLEELECKIRLDASVLSEFIDILKELDAVYYRGLIKTLGKLFL